jgi:hypothetical protein
LVIDTKTPALTRRVPFPLKDGTPARPGSFTPHGDRVYVNLHRLALDFDRAADADIAVLDARSGELERVVALPGLRNCGKPVFSTSGALATACSGVFDRVRARFDDVGAGVVVGEIVDGAFRELERWSVSALGATPTGSVAWMGDGRVAATLFGSAGRGDSVVELRLGDPSPRAIYRAATPYTLGAIRCIAASSIPCALSDASSSAIVQIIADGDALLARTLTASDVTGLPLRDLAFFR